MDGNLSPELPALIAVRYFKSEFGRRICRAQNEFSTAQAFGLFWGIRNVTSRADWDKIHTWSCLVLSNPAAIVGLPAATTAVMARDQLGDAVSVYLDNGTVAGGVASTIVDLTGPQPRLLRRGAISVGRLREVAAVSAGADAGTP